MVDKKGEKLGVAGFTLGIAGIYSFLWMTFLSLPVFITGLVFSWIQIKNRKTKLSIWALIINLAGILFSVLTLILLFKNPGLFATS